MKAHTQFKVSGTVKGYTEEMRQLEIAARISYIRERSQSAHMGDQLLIAENYLASLPGLSMIAIRGAEDHATEDQYLQKLMQLQRCGEAAGHLLFICEQYPLHVQHLASLQTAFALYENAISELLNAIFPEDHQFWRRYYPVEMMHRKRPCAHSEVTLPGTDVAYLQQYYRYFFLGTEAFQLHCRKSNSVNMQLLLQSLRWAYYGYYCTSGMSSAQRRNVFGQALQFTMSIDAPLYWEWICFCRDYPRPLMPFVQG